jgi:hypothetical protein
MKQYKILLLCLLLSINSIGQLETKTWLVGGSGSFYSYNGVYNSPTNSNTIKVNNIDIKASLGYFLINKLVVGLRPSFFCNKGHLYENGNLIGDFGSTTKFLIGPFVRYYFLQQEKQYNLLVDINYLIGKNSYPTSTSERGAINEFSISTGAEIFFNSSCGVEFLVGYKKKYEDIKGNTGYTDKKYGFQLGIGFQLHLQK